MKDYYSILGVDKKATQDEIKKAYRKKARSCHPDKFPGDDSKETEFKELNEANETLSDEHKRLMYDRQQSGEHDNIFDNFFASRRSSGVSAMVNLEARVLVSIDKYFKEEEVKINYSRLKNTGESIVCPSCGGKGGSQESSYGFFASFICGNCGGSGRFIRTVREQESMTLKLSKGKLHYRVNGMGDIIPGQGYGAVVIRLGFTPSDGFHVDEQNYNLIYKMRIGLKEFLTSAELQIDRFGTKYKLKHENISGEAVKYYRLKNRGLVLEQGTTDLIIELTPMLPLTLTEEGLELVDKLCQQPGFSEQSQTP